MPINEQSDLAAVISEQLGSEPAKRLVAQVFQPNGRFAIWALPSNGKPRQAFADSPGRRVLRRDFATGGKRLFFRIGEPDADVWMMSCESGTFRWLPILAAAEHRGPYFSARQAPPRLRGH